MKKTRKINIIETNNTTNQEDIDLLLVGLSTMSNGWMFVWEKENKEYWVWFNEKEYSYIPIPKIGLFLSSILSQPYFNFGALQPIMHDMGYQIIDFIHSKDKDKLNIYTECYRILKEDDLKLKGVYIKRKRQNDYNFYLI